MSEPETWIGGGVVEEITQGLVGFLDERRGIVYTDQIMAIKRPAQPDFCESGCCAQCANLAAAKVTAAVQTAAVQPIASPWMRGDR